MKRLQGHPPTQGPTGVQGLTCVQESMGIRGPNVRRINISQRRQRIVQETEKEFTKRLKKYEKEQRNFMQEG